MNEEEVISRLKGLGKGATPPAPDFADPTIPVTPVATRSRARFGMGPIAAVVGVLALGTAALAVPDGAPLRQVVASLSAEIESDAAEVDADADLDLAEDGSGGSASLLANPCEGPPPLPTSTTVAGTPGGVEGGASVEVDPEDREAQVRAWNEWREANCGPGADEDTSDGGNSGDRGKSDRRGADPRTGSEGNPPSHPHENDPCKGPPPHSSKPGTGDPARDEAQRKAEQEAWQQWHRDNCPPGQTGDRPGNGQGGSQGEGKPENTGKPEGPPGGRPDGAGKSGGARGGQDDGQ